MPWPPLSLTQTMFASRLSSRDWTFRGRISPQEPDALLLRLRQGADVLRLPGISGGSVDLPGKPGFQFAHRAGQFHGTIRAERPSGSCPGARPSFAPMLRAHPAPEGTSRWQRGPCHLTCTCKGACEACTDLLGCDLGSAETGACSAAPAGEAETQTQSGSSCRFGGLNGDQFGVPGCDPRAEPSCTVGTAARLRPRPQEWMTVVLRLKSTFLQRCDTFHTPTRRLPARSNLCPARSCTGAHRRLRCRHCQR